MTDYEIMLETEYVTLCGCLNKLRKCGMAKRHLTFITNRILQVEDSLKHILCGNKWTDKQEDRNG